MVFPKSPNPSSQKPQTSANDPYSRTGASSGRRGGVYPIAGIYPLLRIDTLKMIKNRIGSDLFVADLEILETKVDDRPAGSRMSWIGDYSKDPTPDNVKSFLMAASGLPANAITADEVMNATSNENPLHGRLVRLEATMIKKRNGDPFTLCVFSAVSDELQSRSEDLRTTAGFI